MRKYKRKGRSGKCILIKRKKLFAQTTGEVLNRVIATHPKNDTEGKSVGDPKNHAIRNDRGGRNILQTGGVFADRPFLGKLPPTNRETGKREMEISEMDARFSFKATRPEWSLVLTMKKEKKGNNTKCKRGRQNENIDNVQNG